MSNRIDVQRDGVTTTLVLNRPRKKNALNLAMYTALAEALADARQDREVRAVIVRGEGDTFCAGNDLMDFMQSPPTGDDSPVLSFLTELVDFPKPLIAAVHGAAVGIGTTMLLHCDLAFAAEDTTFKLPFVQLGLNPEAGSSVLFPRAVGHRRAFEMLVLGQPFGTDAALAAGLLNQVVPMEQLQDRVRAAAEAVASLPPEAVRQSKALLRQSDPDLHEAIRREGALFIERVRSEETAEAIMAFLQKRSPDFSRFG